jgi:hypothetical protein
MSTIVALPIAEYLDDACAGPVEVRGRIVAVREIVARERIDERGDPELLALIQERANDARSDVWLTIVGRAVARGDASPDALHPRVATVAVALLRNEYVTRGIPVAPDQVLIDIVDEVFVPLLRGRRVSPSAQPTPVDASPTRRRRAKTRGQQ